MQVNILEAKNRLSELIKLVQSGDDVVIANRGEPVVRLVRTQVAQSEPSSDGFLCWLEEHPLPKHLQRSHAEIELGISEERAAWD
jgi:antitoxin (DNA-binding transcriptional repressor) of toxin-antitoxin stability system